LFCNRTEEICSGIASRFSTARPLPSSTRAAVSAPSRSHIRIITRRWWMGGAIRCANIFAHCRSRWRRGVALASRCKRQRRIAHRRHHPSRARSPLCELHAKLCEPDSARAGRDSTYSQKDRTILSLTNLWRVVESERSLTSMSHRAGVSGRQFV
jgi:hypothetical protein